MNNKLFVYDIKNLQTSDKGGKLFLKFRKGNKKGSCMFNLICNTSGCGSDCDCGVRELKYNESKNENIYFEIETWVGDNIRQEYTIFLNGKKLENSKNMMLRAVRNYDADYFVDKNGNVDDNGTIKRYAIEIQDVFGSVVDYESADSEKNAEKLINKINKKGY